MKNFLLLPLFSISSLILYSQLPADLYLEEFASGFNLPTEIIHAGDDRLFVCEKSGVIKIVDANGQVLDDPFLDISDKVDDFAERGLIGMAFHPDYENNGWFYITYTDLVARNHVVRYSRAANNPDRADQSSEKLLLLLDEEEFHFHLGGCLNFGPDGFLYIAVGDAGYNYEADNLESYLGKILRIDVDNGDPYSIPSDNPYINTNFHEEIWAIGLRNPWKFSFDSANEDFWVADVGEKEREEVTRVDFDSVAGISFGWPCFEGTVQEDSWSCEDANPADHEMPTFEYGHDSFAGCSGSITGGYVYRGQSPRMQDVDAYISGDYCTGEIFATLLVGGVYQTEVIYHNPYFLDNISTFGQDQNGELLVADLVEGKIFKMDFSCKFPEIELTVTSCEEGEDGCVEISIPSDEGIISAEIFNDQNVLISESDYCSLPAGDYILSTMNDSVFCSRDIPFTIESFTPQLLVLKSSCDSLSDGCVEIGINQNLPDYFSFHIETAEGELIDTSDYCSLARGGYNLVVENDSVACYQEFDFFVYSNYDYFAIELIDGTLYAPDTLTSYQWYFSDTLTGFVAFELIEGATDDFHVPENIGFYRCYGVANDGCGQITFSFEIDMLNANQNLQEFSESTIYPNPVLNELNLKLGEYNSRKLHVSILNTKGQLIREDVFELSDGQDILSLKLDDLIAGTYLLKLSSGNLNEVLLFVKQ